MKNLFTLIISCLLLTSCDQATSNAETTGNPPVIGKVNHETNKSKPVVIGELANQQIWVDYIAAHNERNLDKIAEINAQDWVGYTPDGSIVKGSDAHIEILANWFKTSSPKWEIKWMIANAAENKDGVMTQWLTTGNDYTDVDAEGNEVFEHNIHDIQFVDGKIKEIYVYKRAKPQDSLGFSY